MSEPSTIKVERLPDELTAEAAEVMAHAFADGPIYTYIFQGTREYRIELLTWLFERNIIAMRNKDADVALCVRDSKASDNKGGKQLLATFMLVREGFSLNKWDMVKIGLLSMPYKAGLAATGRMLRVLDWFKERYVTFFNPYEKRTGKETIIEKATVEKSSTHITKKSVQGESESDVVDEGVLAGIHSRIRSIYDNTYASDNRNTNPRACRYTLERMTVRPEAQGMGVGSICLQYIVNFVDGTDSVIRLATQKQRTCDWYQSNGFNKTVGTDIFYTEDGNGIKSWFMECSSVE
ncbi:hypothetical protein SARC_07991 [Sphaeroforma arctica JP610]|uniref:N-acetyltransferase domain-containing protein n=1 Tax=Sphaeroforma arctica JP610 TaxID=667725 RepID=A0A0L0FSE4_9EUKA|nr:hypothetical protein SARC_07991 [Sphaeroforma arctica JP610]KNC79619.1 hypothetical protein SARC_07991 [Sphaeroforma arctica JP610]|eukprot:XP_014153521.1 hypothetical protein SARC_07991 [Sphaeroforma arctica JP610]